VVAVRSAPVSVLFAVSVTEYTTVGIQFLKRAGAYFVASTWEGSPAEMAGIQSGDEIVAIQGRPVVALSNIGLHNLLHGAPESRVKLTLRRAGKLKSYELVRKLLL
jgi:carboxyl-terminal processing protease